MKIISYNGIWTYINDFVFVFALAGIKMSPNISMLTFASKEIKYFGTQQIWFSAFLIGFLLIFFKLLLELDQFYLEETIL